MLVKEMVAISVCGYEIYPSKTGRVRISLPSAQITAVFKKSIYPKRAIVPLRLLSFLLIFCNLRIVLAVYKCINDFGKII